MLSLNVPEFFQFKLKDTIQTGNDTSISLYIFVLSSSIWDNNIIRAFPATFDTLPYGSGLGNTHPPTV